MNPLNTVTGTIIAGFVLALILGMAVNAWDRTPGANKMPAKSQTQPK
jgi:hypothetical protein